MTEDQKNARKWMADLVREFTTNKDLDAAERRIAMRGASALALALIAEALWEYHEPSNTRPIEEPPGE